MMESAWDFFWYMMLVVGVSGGIFYVVGRLHQSEHDARKHNVPEAKRPVGYYCCDHCFHPVTGEHYVNDDDVVKFKPDTHSVPCNEDGCIKGRRDNPNVREGFVTNNSVD